MRQKLTPEEQQEIKELQTRLEKIQAIEEIVRKKLMKLVYKIESIS
jgi:hypothetical protein